MRKATVIKVTDGDTIKVSVDLGYRIYPVVTIRFKGINCSDKTLKAELSKEMAKKATKYVTDKILNKEVWVDSYKFKDGDYGRYLGIIYYQEGDKWINLNQELLDIGLAKVYFEGASKVEWEDQ